MLSLPALPPWPLPCVAVQGFHWDSALGKVTLKELFECVLLFCLLFDSLFMRSWEAVLR